MFVLNDLEIDFSKSYKTFSSKEAVWSHVLRSDCLYVYETGRERSIHHAGGSLPTPSPNHHPPAPSRYSHHQSSNCSRFANDLLCIERSLCFLCFFLLLQLLKRNLNTVLSLFKTNTLQSITEYNCTKLTINTKISRKSFNMLS